MPLKFSSTFHSSVWTENFQMFNAHNSLSQPVHLSTTVHARYPFCSLLQSFDRPSLLRILRPLKGLRLDWFLAILFKAEVQLFRLRLRRTGWRKVARRYLAFTSYFSSHSRVMLTSFSILCFIARQRKPKEADVVSTVTNPQNFLPSLCSCPPTWASSLSRRNGNDLTLYKHPYAYSPYCSLHISNVLTRRICETIKSFVNCWSFPLFAWLKHLIQGIDCKEKLEPCHY